MRNNATSLDIRITIIRKNDNYIHAVAAYTCLFTLFMKQMVQSWNLRSLPHFRTFLRS